MFKQLLKKSVFIVFGLSLMSVSAISVADESSLVSYTKTIKHDRDGGGRGTDYLYAPKPATESNMCTAVSSAKVIYKKRLYGSARVVSYPSTECASDASQCTIGVFWKHQPAGRVGYRVKVIWEHVQC